MPGALRLHRAGLAAGTRHVSDALRRRSCHTRRMAPFVLHPATPLDLALTLRLHARGRGDPTMRLATHQAERAGRNGDGAYAIRIWRSGDEIRAEAWGPGAEAAIVGLPGLLGEDDDPAGFQPDRHPLVARLARDIRGLRVGRSGAVLEALVPAVLEQKVTGSEASRAYRGLIARFGEAAPGPLGLRLPPAPATLAALPYYEFHPLGVEQRRAEVIRRAARDARALEGLVAATASCDPSAFLAASRRLQAHPGIGPWTAAEVAIRALGDPDAVSVGDFHLPNLVAWALAGEARADDPRMLSLLAPWAGHRARVIRLLESSGIGAPRYGPRLSPRSIANL